MKTCSESMSETDDVSRLLPNYVKRLLMKQIGTTLTFWLY